MINAHGLFVDELWQVLLIESEDKAQQGGTVLVIMILSVKRYEDSTRESILKMVLLRNSNSSLTECKQGNLVTKLSLVTRLLYP
jgi:predicted TIM-barrel enzyme